jgi:hypothetical protein
MLIYADPLSRQTFIYARSGGTVPFPFIELVSFL